MYVLFQVSVKLDRTRKKESWREREIRRERWRERDKEGEKGKREGEDRET